MRAGRNIRNGRPNPALAALCALVAACTAKAPSPAPVAPPPTAPALSPIHRNLDPLETVWHLRAGLNVAALGCPARVGPAIVSDYNALLAARRPLLKQAYEAKADNYTDDRAFDRDMTRLYNHFAAPAAQTGFCAAAADIAHQALTVAPADFPAFASVSLARLDRAFTEPAQSAKPAEPPPVTVAAAARSAGFQIQLGAFTGQAGAEAAWARIRDRAPDLASFQPRYQPVPGKAPLVRLRLTAASDRADAIKLCALAAAAGFDCMPVAPGV